MFPRVIFSSIPFTFSFAKVFFFYGISMVLLLDFYGIPMGYFWRISMGFLKGCYGSSMVFLWDFHWIPMGFLWYFY